MRKVFGCAALLVAALLLDPAASPSQQKNNDRKKDTVIKEETAAQDYTNLAQLKEIFGKIADVDLKAGTMTLTIEWSHWEVNPNANGNAAANQNQKLLQQQQQAWREYNAMMLAKNPMQQQQAQARFQARLQQLQATAGATMANMFHMVKSSKDFDLPVMDNVKVVRAKLEEKYTDEGEPIKYTSAELKKIKSPDISGAFVASPEDLVPGLIVRLYLSPPKKGDTKKVDKNAKKSDSIAIDSKDSADKRATDAQDKKTADSKDQQTADNKDKQTPDAKDKQTPDSKHAGRPRVRMVLILDQANMPEPPADTPKKKKDG
jgi:hypothetical protein